MIDKKNFTLASIPQAEQRIAKGYDGEDHKASNGKEIYINMKKRRLAFSFLAIFPFAPSFITVLIVKSGHLEEDCQLQCF